MWALRKCLQCLQSYKKFDILKSSKQSGSKNSGKVENHMSKEKLDEIIATSKLSELLSKKDDEKMKKALIWTLAIIGTVAAIAGIAYAVYRFLAPDYFEEDFEDDFEEDYFDGEDEV